jgi:hypothetical protein
MDEVADLLVSCTRSSQAYPGPEPASWARDDSLEDPWVPDDPAALPVLRDALEAWRLVRESIDCPECDDHWQRDRLVLSR